MELPQKLGDVESGVKNDPGDGIRRLVHKYPTFQTFAGIFSAIMAAPVCEMLARALAVEVEANSGSSCVHRGQRIFAIRDAADFHHHASNARNAPRRIA